MFERHSQSNSEAQEAVPPVLNAPGRRGRHARGLSGFNVVADRLANTVLDRSVETLRSPGVQGVASGAGTVAVEGAGTTVSTGGEQDVTTAGTTVIGRDWNAPSVPTTGAEQQGLVIRPGHGAGATPATVRPFVPGGVIGRQT
jgi:hypothetical protein